MSEQTLTPPTQPYSRELSKLLIRCRKLAVQQYKTGRANPNYDGAINLLPAYHSGLKDYTQLTNFTNTQEIIEDCPRVGSPAFAKRHSQLIPNAYRIVNLGDTAPLAPPITLGDSYVHIGQEWSFLAQFGDVLLNHVVDTYQAALEQEAETDQVLSPVKRITT